MTGYDDAVDNSNACNTKDALMLLNGRNVAASKGRAFEARRGEVLRQKREAKEGKDGVWC
ncbi:hypothetical protein HYFRA_00014214 [Hymenoscyphus fraxineus]|uniref:Uncharacterized protein n=1 Tax=Hymenoscyphus fraxineus TaxID=746836 RepID=A0A9N9Q0G9_9HELO|nr:hypothetical protein HYFRA_00014214 [Hymenoscyphus fraxineus]